jgi:hypothetical protein
VTLTAEATLDEALAQHYAADLLYRALIEAGEPIKASEAARLVGREDVDLRLARVILTIHPDRFTSTERRWTLWTRFADPQRSVERNIEEVINTYGQPIRLAALARELSAIYGRSTEYYERILPRMMNNRERYFPLGEDAYAPTSWLLDVQSDSAEDVLFDNYLTAPDAAKYDSAAGRLDPAKPDTVVKLLDTVHAPVGNKVLQFLAWRANPERFDAVSFFTTLWNGGKAAFLSGGWWIGPKAAAALAGFFPALAAREVVELSESMQAEAAQPLVISDEESEQIVQAVLQSETTSRAKRLLESIFEVSPGDTTFEGDLQTVENVLRGDERIVWVGSDRFLPAGTIPEYVFSVPESLRIPVTRYTDVEGNEVDLLLEDDGFDGGLQREVLSPLAQDVLDEEPAYTPDKDPPSTARCVLKLHHKEIGTFPLCQLPAGFFPVDAPVIQADIMLPTGHTAEVWVNNEARLLYGLLDWYLSLPVDSGAVFYLERQSPDHFTLTYGEETEAAMFISRNRVNELLELGRRAEEEELPTFDILREIMEHYRKGIEFVTLMTEANIARRTTRRLVASLLSGYHCFFQRGGAWVYDAKKLSQGFDKSKRKYLIR